MENESYERLPTASLTTNMTAGAVAGVLEFGLMYPIDSVRTRMQSLTPESTNTTILKTLLNMVKTEGLFRPVRGISVVIAGTIPAHALYFGSYELSKEFLSNLTTRNNINYMTSGVIATILHDAVANPTEVIKQRLQMYNSPYQSVIACVKDIYKDEGPKAFYRSFPTQVLLNIPFQAIHFVTYEFVQNIANPDRKYSPLVHVVAGGAAGGVAAAFTTPLDVIKTLLNTQERGFTRGMVEATKRIYTAAGPMAFFKGVTARILHTMPGTAICWSTYEFFKFYFSDLEKKRGKSFQKTTEGGKVD